MSGCSFFRRLEIQCFRATQFCGLVGQSRACMNTGMQHVGLMHGKHQEHHGNSKNARSIGTCSCEAVFTSERRTCQFRCRDCDSLEWRAYSWTCYPARCNGKSRWVLAAFVSIGQTFAVTNQQKKPSCCGQALNGREAGPLWVKHVPALARPYPRLVGVRNGRSHPSRSSTQRLPSMKQSETQTVYTEPTIRYVNGRWKEG